ncbi:WD40 repeat domain-containing protein [uncultured Bacteroides sp.]|uniref:WD40 repeat domain-containing protein n=1 Tax=uncultured Bacteroides sp. TaxID=162156 RepID=UPI00262A5BD8|nr:WD40 repeat domain-containing protein [uncultured Bacteroides sp.]
MLTATLGINVASAQINYKKEFPSQYEIKMFDNTTYCIAYLSNGELLALRDNPITTYTKLNNMVFNPTGSSIAVSRPGKDIMIFSFYKKDRKLFTLKEKRKEYKKAETTSMCYSDNARHFIEGTSANEIIIYDTKEYLPQAYIKTSSPATSLEMSSNNYFIASSHGNEINIWNFNTKELRKNIKTGATLTGSCFNKDASQFAVTTKEKGLEIFDTKTWTVCHTFDSIGGTLRNPYFHPDGKYIAVVKDDSKVIVINLKNNKIEQEIDEADKGISRLKFFMDNQSKDVFMISGRKKSISFWDANGLNPFYGKLVNSEVDAKMNEWMKMMQGETMEEYAIRVNDETRLKQQILFENEAATKLAGDRISLENPFIGNYDTTNGMLNVGFNTMSSIALEVPMEDLDSFKDSKDLKFENAVYYLNENDEFELAYVEVKNETTNKVYIYDNLGRQKMSAIQDDSNFVPLEIIQQASQEEAKLEAIKENVVAENKQDELITDNTQINVKTEVVPDVNANGEKILNYKVGYQYEVINKEFSAKEDFPSGGYDIQNSNAAMSLMKIIKNAFEGEFANYLGEGKQVKIIITGSADASPIRSKIAYKGQYGEFVDEPYYKDGNLDNITVTKESGITRNEQLALLRAAGVMDYIKNNVNTLKTTKNEFEYHVEVAKERGGEFRRINIEFLIVDAFPNAKK